MSTLKTKLSSRKLWAAIIGILTGLAMIFGLDENIIGTVAGAVVELMSIVIYIYSEGKIDAARVANTIEDIQDVVDIMD